MDTCLENNDTVRGFEIVEEWARQKSTVLPFIPKRKTNHSAGYDLAVLDGATINPGEVVHFMTNIKAYMMEDELLIIFGQDLLMRASVWMTLRESKASFTIEGEGKELKRIERFADVMARRTGKGDIPLDPESLAPSTLVT